MPKVKLTREMFDGMMSPYWDALIQKTSPPDRQERKVRTVPKLEELMKRVKGR